MAKASKPKGVTAEPDDSEDFIKAVSFKGTLSRDSVSIPTRFSARVESDGALRVKLRPILLTTETAAIWQVLDRKGPRVAYFKLEGVSKRGTNFRSDDTIIVSSGTKSSPDKSHIVLGVECRRAILTRAFTGPRSGPAVAIRQSLRGFEGYDSLQAYTPLGEVRMWGAYPLKDRDRLKGGLAITLADAPADVLAWRREVEALFQHVCLVMSFAGAHHIKAPLQQVWTADQWELSTSNQSKSRKNHPPVFHPMVLQPIFDAAVASYFAPPIQARNLHFALEWFAMEAVYTETRLTNAMTALENLVDSNLEPPDQFVLPPKVFEKTAKAMRQAARSHLAAALDPDDPQAKSFIEALPGKMQDLNRRALYPKIQLLAERWGAPIDDLPADEIKRAIAARNLVVHRGYCYEPAPAPPSDRDLWDHALLMREVVVRFVLTALGFRGNYLSFRGGQHDVAFPPPGVRPPAP